MWRGTIELVLLLPKLLIGLSFEHALLESTGDEAFLLSKLRTFLLTLTLGKTLVNQLPFELPGLSCVRVRQD
jgi:hypothetical protein